MSRSWPLLACSSTLVMTLVYIKAATKRMVSCWWNNSAWYVYALIEITLMNTNKMGWSLPCLLTFIQSYKAIHFDRIVPSLSHSQSNFYILYLFVLVTVNICVKHINILNYRYKTNLLGRRCIYTTHTLHILSVRRLRNIY